ncbi:hypothetical protein XENTR_v10009162 [Xenopus tropicalis]|uniref:Protein PIGBOS1 n=2 Tax=Xenopus tropicalis TaxID=8364 RepID=A0A8J0SSG5_XENTR|eukprot:XP_017947911.1 PREDICTED: protein PIGBOS1 [Xenopus tropicalis]
MPLVGVCLTCVVAFTSSVPSGTDLSPGKLLEMYRRLSLPQLFLATFLGVAGGVYIYKPIFEQYMWEQKSLKQEAQTIETVEQNEQLSK